MTDVASLRVKFESDGEDKVSNDAQSLGDKLEAVGEKSKKAGTMMSLGVTTPILAMGRSMVMASSDMDESLSKVNTVFGANASAVTNWAATSASSVGLAESEALGAAGTFGNLFTGMGMSQDAAAGMSTEMIQLAADLSSFNNVPIEESLAAIQSGLVGEAEPMRQFGVLMNDANVTAKAMEMGLADANGEISEQAKVLARQQLMMEQTTNAQGDFARTSEGTANSMRIAQAEFKNAQAELGQGLLPMVTSAIQGFTGFMQAISNLSPRAQKLVLVIAGIAAAVGPLLIAFGMMLPGLAAVGTAIGLILSPIGLLVAAVALVAYAFRGQLIGAFKAVASAIGEFIGGFTKAWSALDGNPIAKFLLSVQRGLAAIGGENTPAWIANVAKAFGIAGVKVQALASAFKRFRSLGLNPVEAGLTALRSVFPGLSGVLTPLIVVIGRFTTAFQRARDAGMNPLRAAVAGLSAIFPGLSGMFSNLADMAVSLWYAFASGLSVIKNLVQAFGDLLTGDLAGAWDNLKDAASDFMDQLGRLGDAGKSAGKALISAFQAIDWGGLWKGIQNAWDAIPWQEMGRKAIDWIKNALSNAGGASGIFQWISDALMDALQGMSNAFMSGLQMAWDMITNINWSDFIPDIDWGNFISKVADFGVYLAGKIKDLPWKDFINGTVDIVMWVASKIKDLPWGDFINGTVDIVLWVASKIKELPWKDFINGTVDIVLWVASKIKELPWGDFINGTVDIVLWVASKIKNLPWGDFIRGTVDIVLWVSSKIKNLPWGDFINGVVDIVLWVTSKIKQFPWGDFVSGVWDIVQWATDLAAKVAGAVPWPEISWPSASEIANAIASAVAAKFNPTGTSTDPDADGDGQVTVPNPDDPMKGPILAPAEPSGKASGLLMGWNISKPGGAGIANAAPTSIPAPDTPAVLEAIAACREAVITFVADTIGVLGGWVGGVNNILLTAGTAFTTVSLSPATATTAIVAFVANTIGVMGGWVGGITTILATGGQSFMNMGPIVMAAVTFFTTFVANTIGVMGGWVGGVSVILATAGTAFTGLSGPLAAATASVVSFVAGTIGVLGGWVGGVNTMVSSTMATFRSTISSGTSTGKSSFVTFVGDTIGVMGGWSGGMRNIVSSTMSGIVSAASSGMSQMAGAFRSGASDAARAVQGALSAIPGIVSGIGGEAARAARAAGAEIGAGFAQGMEGSLGRIEAAAAAMASAAEAAVKAKAIISSPSRLFRRLGEYVGEGFEGGIRAMIPATARAAGDLVAIPQVTPMTPGRLETRRAGADATQNTFLVISGEVLQDFLDTVEGFKVLTDPAEVAAVFGGR